MLNDLKKFCTPAKIYFAIALVASILALLNGVKLLAVGWQMLFALVWTYVLGWLCKKGYRNVSWFLVLLPYILMFIAMFNVLRVTRDIMRMVRLQGAYGQEAMVPARARRAAELNNSV